MAAALPVSIRDFLDIYQSASTRVIVKEKPTRPTRSTQTLNLQHYTSTKSAQPPYNVHVLFCPTHPIRPQLDNIRRPVFLPKTGVFHPAPDVVLVLDDEEIRDGGVC